MLRLRKGTIIEVSKGMLCRLSLQLLCSSCAYRVDRRENDENVRFGTKCESGFPFRHPHGNSFAQRRMTAVPHETLIDRLKRSMPYISSFVLTDAWCCIRAIDIGPDEPAASPRFDGHCCVDYRSRSDIACARGRSYVLDVCLCPLVAGFYAPCCVECIATAASCRLIQESTLLAYGIATCICYMLGSGACVALLPSKVTF